MRSTDWERPPLRLFDGTAARSPERGRTKRDGVLSDEMSLGEYYRRSFIRDYLGFYELADGTRKVYDNALEWWAKLTGDPPLWRIDDELLDRFTVELRRQPGRRGERLAEASVHRVLRHLDTVLKTTGPRDRGNKRGKGILHAAPFFEKPQLAKAPVKRRFTVEQLQAVYAAAGRMRAPKLHRTRITPRFFWELTVALFYYTGFRKTETLLMTWADLVERETASGVESFLLLPKAIRKGRVEDHCKWVHPDLEKLLAAARAVARRDAQFPRCPILPWPHDERYLERLFKRLCEKAGVRRTEREQEASGVREWDLAFHAVRRTHLNLFYASRLVKLREQALSETQAAAGHADLATTRGHYLEEDPLEVAAALAPAIAGLPSIVGAARGAARA